MTLGEKFILACCAEAEPELFFKTPKEYFDKTEIIKQKFIGDYYLKHGEFPPLDVFNSKFKVKYTYPSGKAAYFNSELKNRFVYVTLSEEIPKVIRGLKGNPIAGLDTLKTIISSVHIADRQSRDSVWSENTEERFKAYEEIRDLDGIAYISTGDEILDSIFHGYNRTDLITIGGPPGLGKCLGKGTKVLMFDLSVRNVEDVKVGDLLMGPDGRSRRVLSLARGREMMYWIHQNKGMSYRVNESHILSLKTSGYNNYPNGCVHNISVKDYLKKSQNWKEGHKGYKASVMEFKEKALFLEPYLLGLWLGDGSRRNATITTTDKEIIEYLNKKAVQYGLNLTKNKITYSLSCKKGSSDNPLINSLRLYNLLNEPRLNDRGEKRIPEAFLKNTRYNRLQVLAGLIDSDGHLCSRGVYEISQKRRELAEDIAKLCRSLGYYVNFKHKVAVCNGKKSTVYRLIISGNVDEIPVRVERKKSLKRRINKNPLITGISVVKDKVDDYYGFTIDGDHLFCLEDFTVTHNTWYICKRAIDCDATLPDNYGPILVVTNEISKDDMEQRYDAIRFKLNYERFITGSLSKRHEKRYQRGLKSLERKGSRIITLDGCNTLEELNSKIVMYKPAITFVDGSYLLEPQMEEGFAKSVLITRNLKQMVKENKTPMLNTTQVRKGRGKKAAKTMLDRQDDFYYGSIIQDSDIAMRMYQTVDMVFYGKVALDIAKGRKVKTGTKVYFVSDLETMDMHHELETENAVVEDENTNVEF